MRFFNFSLLIAMLAVGSLAFAKTSEYERCVKDIKKYRNYTNFIGSICRDAALSDSVDSSIETIELLIKNKLLSDDVYVRKGYYTANQMAHFISQLPSDMKPDLMSTIYKNLYSPGTYPNEAYVPSIYKAFQTIDSTPLHQYCMNQVKGNMIRGTYEPELFDIMCRLAKTKYAADCLYVLSRSHNDINRRTPLLRACIHMETEAQLDEFAPKRKNGTRRVPFFTIDESEIYDLYVYSPAIGV